jgi:hypothetical protein
MKVGTLRIGKKEFVVVPRRWYERQAARLAEDERDVRLARAAWAEYRRTGKSITLDKLKRELGK